MLQCKFGFNKQREMNAEVIQTYSFCLCEVVQSEEKYASKHIKLIVLGKANSKLMNS